MNRLPILAALAVAAAFAYAPSARAADDYKFVAASECEPFPPDTNIAALRHTLAGLYNPGTEIERVICPMPRDQDDYYLSNELEVVAYYRAGSVSGRMSCTLYVGSTAMQTTSVYSVSKTGLVAAPNAREYLTISGGGGSQDFFAVPLSVLCSLDPKITFAGLFFDERGPTTTP